MIFDFKYSIQITLERMPLVIYRVLENIFFFYPFMYFELENDDMESSKRQEHEAKT